MRCGKRARSRSARSSRQRSRLNAVCLWEGWSWIVSGIRENFILLIRTRQAWGPERRMTRFLALEPVGRIAITGDACSIFQTHRAHSWLYEPFKNRAKIAMLQRFNFALFSGRPAPRPTAKGPRGEGSEGSLRLLAFRPLLVNYPRVALSFLGPQRKTFLLSNPVGEKKR